MYQLSFLPFSPCYLASTVAERFHGTHLYATVPSLCSYSYPSLLHSSKQHRPQSKNLPPPHLPSPITVSSEHTSPTSSRSEPQRVSFFSKLSLPLRWLVTSSFQPRRLHFRYPYAVCQTLCVTTVLRIINMFLFVFISEKSKAKNAKKKLFIYLFLKSDVISRTVVTRGAQHGADGWQERGRWRGWWSF